MKFESYPLEDYPKVDEVSFPRKIAIAYAVCAKSCGNVGYIVDGQTQVCEHCGKLMFRTEVMEYSINAD